MVSFSHKFIHEVTTNTGHIQHTLYSSIDMQMCAQSVQRNSPAGQVQE